MERLLVLDQGLMAPVFPAVATGNAALEISSGCQGHFVEDLDGSQSQDRVVVCQCEVGMALGSPFCGLQGERTGKPGECSPESHTRQPDSVRFPGGTAPEGP